MSDVLQSCAPTGSTPLFLYEIELEQATAQREVPFCLKGRDDPTGSPSAPGCATPFAGDQVNRSGSGFVPKPPQFDWAREHFIRFAFLSNRPLPNVCPFYTPDISLQLRYWRIYSSFFRFFLSSLSYLFYIMGFEKLI